MRDAIENQHKEGRNERCADAFANSHGRRVRPSIGIVDFAESSSSRCIQLEESDSPLPLRARRSGPLPSSPGRPTATAVARHEGRMASLELRRGSVPSSARAQLAFSVMSRSSNLSGRSRHGVGRGRTRCVSDVTVTKKAERCNCIASPMEICVRLSLSHES